jgi:competence protein ComEA
MVFQKIKSFLFNFFHFNKQERNGVFVLCIIIAMLFGVRLLMPLVNNDSNSVQFITIAPSEKHVKEEISLYENEVKNTNSEIKTSNQRFVFNPNTVSEEDAQKLGMSKKLSATLINFRNKGGKFFKPEDLKKLYGLPPQLLKS